MILGYHGSVDYDQLPTWDLWMASEGNFEARAALLRRLIPETFGDTETKDIAAGAPGMGSHAISYGVGTVIQSQEDEPPRFYKRKLRRMRGLAYRRPSQSA